MDEPYTDEILAASQLLAQAILKREPNLRRRARTIDEVVRRVVRLVGLSSMKQIFAALVDDEVKDAERAGLKVHRTSRLCFSVVFGVIEVVAPYLWVAGAAAGRNVAGLLGLSHHGRSRAVERALSDFGSEESFGEASKRFKEHYGCEVGRTTMLRVTEGHAHAMERYVDERLQEARLGYGKVDTKPVAANDDTVSSSNIIAQPASGGILIELDGCEIRTGTLSLKPGDDKTPVRQLPRRQRTTAWRDVRVGFARRLGEVTRTYVARMASYPDVVGQLFSAAVDRGMTETTKIFGVGDGGNGLCEELKAQFAGMTFLLDRPHLKSHLYETADAMGITGDARKAHIDNQMKVIDDGRVDDVIQQLEHDEGGGCDRERRLAGYLTRFHDCLDYEGAKLAGVPLGSGEVESAHRSIPQKRLKLPGAWWDPSNMNAMLAMRVVRANGWWDDYWSAAAA